jgi:hypothetical protein
MSKQTAVEFFELELSKLDMSKVTNENYMFYITPIFEQAKEMEKEQIIDAYLAGTLQFDNAASIVYPKTPEHYFNETYKGGENV